MSFKRTNPPDIPFLQAAGVSHTGRVRQNNEDNYLVAIDQGLFIVSDGMGGHQAGEIASELVVTILPQIIEKKLAGLSSFQIGDFEDLLKRTIFELSQRLYIESKDRIGTQGMGATVAVTWFQKEQQVVHIAHMGDSRIYLFRQNQLKQLTEDHSVVELLLKHKDIAQEEAQRHPARGQLTRYVGMQEEAYPDVQSMNFQTDDRFLLCTDGLTNMVLDKKIAQLLSADDDPQIICQILVNEANIFGGQDNITAVIIDCKS